MVHSLVSNADIQYNWSYTSALPTSPHMLLHGVDSDKFITCHWNADLSDCQSGELVGHAGPSFLCRVDYWRYKMILTKFTLLVKHPYGLKRALFLAHGQGSNRCGFFSTKPPSFSSLAEH